MTIDWDDRREGQADSDRLKRLAEEAIGATLQADGLTRKVYIGVALVSEEEIREINRQFRAVDQATDVLSFPITDYDIASTTHVGDIDPETGELLLGDIVVSVERARAQALEYGHSFEREFSFLVTHGMLHLIGYDHEIEEDTRVMRQMEESIMDAMGLQREQA